MAIERNRLLRTMAAAEHLTLAPSTLERFRQQGRGPRFVRLGGRAIRYRFEDLEAWIDDPDTNETGRRPAAAGERSGKDADQPKKRRR